MEGCWIKKGGKILYPSNDVMASIRNILDTEDMYLGLRVVTPGPDGGVSRYSVGDSAPVSYVWDDGYPTDEEMDGTSSIGIDAQTLESDIRNFLVGGYRGDQVLLLGSDYSVRGSDIGERILRDAVVLAVWDIRRED